MDFSNFLQHLTLHLCWNCGTICENKLYEIHSNWNQQCSAYGVVDITICWCCFDIQSSCFGWCVIVLHGSSNMYGGKCYHHHFDPLIPINLFPALLWLDTIHTMGWTISEVTTFILQSSNSCQQIYLLLSISSK